MTPKYQNNKRNTVEKLNSYGITDQTCQKWKETENNSKILVGKK